MHLMLQSVQLMESLERSYLYTMLGCGKTLVCNTIAAAVCSGGKIVLCAASSAIAALLLDGGLTAHSKFGILLIIFETSVGLG